MKSLRIAGKAWLAFFRDDGINLAGAMSFFTMMALVPLCLFIITLVGHFLGQYPDFYRFFITKVSDFFPAVTSGVTNEVARLIAYHGFGEFSILLYGLLSFQVYASIERSFYKIFKVKTKRNFIISLLISFVVVTTILVLLFLSFAATSLVQMLKAFGPQFPALKIGAIARFLIRFVVPFVLVFLTVLILYILVPKRNIRISHAFWGALFTAVFLEIAKHLFAWYVTTLGQFGSIYGPLTAIVLFLLWMFYSSCIFLIGAEIVHELFLDRKNG